MITLHDWLSHFRKPSSAAAPVKKRRAQLDPLEERRLLTVSEPVDTLDASEGSTDELQPFVFVLSTSAGEPVLQSPSGTEPVGPLTLEESGSGEGYAWVQGSGSGSGYVPGSVLASSGPLDWESTSSSGSTTETGGDGWGAFGSSSGDTSGSGGESGSGDGSASGYGSAWGSGSGETSGSGFGESSGSGTGSTSGSGDGDSSGSGSGGSSDSGSGTGSSSGSGSGASGSGSEDNTPPVIHDFNWVFEDGFFTFTGSVTDDEDPAGLTIIFGGAISSSCVVEANGSFQFVTTIDNPLGEVTSQVQDRDLAWSEIETVFI